MMLHVVGRVTEGVAGFLVPSIEYLLSQGVRQHVLMLDEAANPAALALIPREVGVTRVPAPAGALAPWLALRAAMRRFAPAGADVASVHFHGLRPWMLGMLETRSWGAAPLTFVSPHGSRLLPLLPWLAATRYGPAGTRADGGPGAPGRAVLIATSDHEARRLRGWGLASRDANPVVDSVFFDDACAPPIRPVVVAGAYAPSRAGSARVAHLAVILSSAAHGLQFKWLGPCTGASRDQLEAAGCAVLPLAPQGAAREVLAQASIFVAATPDPRLPLLLAQAMALGRACIAIDTPAHADLVEHGRTGLIARDEWSLAESVSRLLDDPALGARLGTAAREEARRRFSAERFSMGVVENYGVAPRRQAQAPAPDATSAQEVVRELGA